MFQKDWLVWALAVAAVLPAADSLPRNTAVADAIVSIDIADLRSRLEKDLLARLPSDFAFVDRVIELVEQGTLPLNLVNRMYLWARKKPKNQFQYFERALRIQASQLGIEI